MIDILERAWRGETAPVTVGYDSGEVHIGNGYVGTTEDDEAALDDFIDQFLKEGDDDHVKSCVA